MWERSFCKPVRRIRLAEKPQNLNISKIDAICTAWDQATVVRLETATIPGMDLVPKGVSVACWLQIVETTPIEVQALPCRFPVRKPVS